ncbi:MAG: thermonuclease family protein [Hyphomicrobiales bacterium]
MLELILCASLMVIDGDNVRCDGVNLRILGDGAPDIVGVDAPEIDWRADCDYEIQLGQQATERLAQLIQTPGLVIEDSGEIDHFERPLVTLRLPDGQTAGQVLIDEGLAVEWTPEYTANWCD